MAVQNTRNQGHRAGEGGSCRELGKGGLELTPHGGAGSGGAGRGHGGFLFAASSSEALCRGRMACPSAISFPRLWPGVPTVLWQCPQPSHPAPAHKVRAILGRGPQSSPPIRLTSTTSSSLPWPSPQGWTCLRLPIFKRRAGACPKQRLSLWTPVLQGFPQLPPRHLYLGALTSLWRRADLPPSFSEGFREF